MERIYAARVCGVWAVGCGLLLGCASSGTVQQATLEASTNEEAPLPNGSMETAQPLVPGEELHGWQQQRVLGGGHILQWRAGHLIGQ